MYNIVACNVHTKMYYTNNKKITFKSILLASYEIKSREHHATAGYVCLPEFTIYLCSISYLYLLFYH